MRKTHNIKDPIFANITSLFGSAVILVRLSGEFSKIVAFCDATGIESSKLVHQKAFLSKIYFKDGVLLDEALFTFFKAPNSFTGEDVFEISIHGSRFIFEELSKILIDIGFRFAKNGEFSYRAFLNNKTDLIQAEGIANLIASETALQHKLSMRQFAGESSKVFNSLRDAILEIVSDIESLIDFSDEELPETIIIHLEKKVAELQKEIEKYVQNNSILNINEGLKVVIIGRPNAGKSSIFNRFINKEKAIVSSIPGTTRDIIEEKIVLHGIPLIFHDTAGLRENTENEIEIEGIKRTRKSISKSDIKILVKPVDSNETFEELAGALNFIIDENTILLTNKSDIASSRSNGLYVSAKTGEGFEHLLNTISKILEEKFIPLISTALIANERQRILLSKAAMFLNRFSLSKEIELASEDLRLSYRMIEEVIGKINTEDVLGSIFSKFCIGK